MSTKFFLALLGGLCLTGVSVSDEEDGKGKADQKPRIIQVDLDKLPPELARQLLAELSKGGKDHSKDWHRPYDFSKMPPGIADKMFGLLPPGIARKASKYGSVNRSHSRTSRPGPRSQKSWACVSARSAGLCDGPNQRHRHSDSTACARARVASWYCWATARSLSSA